MMDQERDDLGRYYANGYELYTKAQATIAPETELSSCEQAITLQIADSLNRAFWRGARDAVTDRMRESPALAAARAASEPDAAA